MSSILPQDNWHTIKKSYANILFIMLYFVCAMSATDIRKYFYIKILRKEILKKKTQNFDTLYINVNENTECLNFCLKFN